ncbi:MAG: alpha/beta hydrolase [Flavobacterium sp.]
MKKIYLIMLGIAGILSLPMAAQTKSTIIKLDNVKSKYVAPRNVEIYLPAAYFAEPNRRFPVLYMHDGQNVFNPETSTHKIAWDADKAADSLINAKIMQPVIIVAMWNTVNTRYMEYFPEKAFNYFKPEDKKAMDDLVKLMNVEPNWLADEYLKFIIEELKPYMDQNYQTLPDQANTAICGSSMGGLISMYAMSEYPEVFGQAACISTHWPVLFDNQNMGPSQAIRDYMNGKFPSPKKHRIWFDFGTNTLDQYYQVHQNMVDAMMKKKGYKKGKNWETHKYKGAEHNEKAWRDRFAEVLTFLYRKR